MIEQITPFKTCTLNLPSAFGAHPYYVHYYQSLRSLGYPQNLRKIAVANGSLTGSSNLSGCAEAIELDSRFNIRVSKIQLFPSQGTCEIFYGMFSPSQPAYVFGKRTRMWIMADAGTHCSIDAAPGGTYNTFEQIREAAKKASDLIKAIDMTNASHSFMPVTSTLDISGNMNYCTNISGMNLAALGKTPFQSYCGSGSSANMEHVSFNDHIVTYLINEVETYITGEKEMSLCATGTFTLHLPANRVNNTSIQWTCSGLEIVSGQGTPTVQVRAITEGQVWIKATPSNLSYNQEVKFDVTVSGNPALPPLPSDFDINNDEHVIWNTPVTLDRELNIRWNSELKITAPVYCTPGADIRVQGGGRLIIDGGTLTSGCNGVMWPGIKVLGNSSKAQTELGVQGWLQIGNSSTIEHAVCAIRNYALLSNGSADLGTTGGNISVSSTRFIDNAQMVSLAPYTRSGNRATSFTDCTFEITPSYDFDHAVSSYMVDIKDLKMVYFIKCDFNYPCDAASTFPPGDVGNEQLLLPWITAIRAINTQLTVKGRELCPAPVVLGCNSYDNGTFTGFETAIEAWYTGNTGGTGQLKIDHINFDHNNQGVIIHGYPNFSVTNSDFNIGWGRYLYPRWGAVGIATESTPIFDLYENSFTGNMYNATGIHIINSRTVNSCSYRNIFNNLTVAQHFTGYNRVLNGTTGPNEGLRYSCNVNTGNREYDILVDTVFSKFTAILLPFSLADLRFDKHRFSTAFGQGVAYHQAAGNSNALAAGNQFSAGATWHIADYAYAQEYAGSTQASEMPARTVNIRTCQANPRTCPSMNSVDIWHEHINFENLSIGDIIPDGIINPSDNRTLEPAYHHFRNSTNTLQYLYNQHMNSDNTEALLDAVQGEWKDDVWKMRQELIEKSPFVDEKVLREIAEQNLLPQALLLEICLANPDATKNPDFIYFLQYKIKN
ncbi:MAG: hypothetical protein LBK03_03860, partial [Bacteroidales bacterium]|nr:hypothetical protein [Bacteroidales bacterium]